MGGELLSSFISILCEVFVSGVVVIVLVFFKAQFINRRQQEKPLII